MRFPTRSEAGRRLAARIVAEKPEDPVVLAFPPGGVPVASEVARALRCPMDVWVVRGLTSPNNEELVIGAIGEEDALYLEKRILHLLDVPEAEAIAHAEQAFSALLDRVRFFRRGRPPHPLRGRTVFLVSDRVVSAAPVRAAVHAIRRHDPARIVLAAPIGLSDELDQLGNVVDEILCLAPASWLGHASAWYEEPSPVNDDLARELLERTQQELERPPTQTFRIGSDTFEADVHVPTSPRGLVVLVEGAPNAREHPRIRAIERALRAQGMATVVPGLLADGSGSVNGRAVTLLADRLTRLVDHLSSSPPFSVLKLGVIGMDASGAAVLRAAAQRPDRIDAVVCCGARPDLAGPILGQVSAPTLLIAGGADVLIAELNRHALDTLAGPAELTVIRAAGHTFEEPGALQEVGRLAGEWFQRFLSPPGEEQRHPAP